MIGRREPYTAIGIKRVKCCVAGCQNRATYQWQCCANDNLWMPLCVTHDVALNRVALTFIGHPDAERLLKRYEARVGREADREEGR